MKKIENNIKIQIKALLKTVKDAKLLDIKTEYVTEYMLQCNLRLAINILKFLLKE